MGEIKVQVTPNKPQSLQVGTKDVKTPIQVEENPTHYYSTLAKQWAVKMDGKVQDEDFSSKYWAQDSKNQANISAAAAETASNLVDLLDNNYTNYAANLEELSSETTSEITELKQNSLADIEQKHVSAIEDIITTKISAIDKLNDVNNEIQNEIYQSKTNAVNTIQDEGAAQIANIQQTGIDSRANIDLSNLSAIGEKHFLNKTQITNCLLEVPQKVNLVDNGTNIVIKAGTIGVRPNGFEADSTTPKFEYITATSDYVLENNQSGDKLIGLYGASSAYRSPVNSCFSGPTAPASPTDYSMWYDTDANLIKRYYNSAWHTGSYTFPLALLNYTSSGSPGSIEQIFNGMGYIGLTIWVDKGVKGLAPNLRNSDGTLNNVAVAIPSVKIYNNEDGYAPANRYILITQNGNLVRYTPYTYDEDKNINLTSSGSPQVMCPAIQFSTSVSQITGFKPLLPFRAADAQDVDGNWVYKKQVLASEVVPTKAQVLVTFSYDLANYLPNDGNTYEVIVNGYIWTGSSAGSSLSIEVVPSNKANYYICGTKTTGGGFVTSVGNALAIIDSTRILKVGYFASQVNVGQVRKIEVCGYRKVR